MLFEKSCFIVYGAASNATNSAFETTLLLLHFDINNDNCRDIQQSASRGTDQSGSEGKSVLDAFNGCLYAKLGQIGALLLCFYPIDLCFIYSCRLGKEQNTADKRNYCGHDYQKRIVLRCEKILGEICFEKQCVEVENKVYYHTRQQ